MPEQTLTSHPSSIRFTSKPQTATLWTLNLHSFCCLFLSLQKGLPTKHYCLHCAIRRHHHAHLPCRWMSLGACSLGGLLYPGNGGSLRDLTLKPRYWLLPLFLLFVVVVVFFIYLLNMCVCVLCVCVCVCVLVCSWLWVVVVVESGGGGWGGYADIRMGQFRLLWLWLGLPSGLCWLAPLWMLWTSRWTAESC